VEKPWQYHHNDENGDAVYIDNLVATNRAGVASLVSELQWRWPNWRRMKLFAIRRGKLVEYQRGTVL
jgi:hypothetical protein